MNKGVSMKADGMALFAQCKARAFYRANALIRIKIRPFLQIKQAGKLIITGASSY